MAPTPPYPSYCEYRRNLDARFCYLILEGGEGAELEMEAVFTSLPLRAWEVAEKQLCRDGEHRRLFLVARLVRGRGESIRKRILSATLPPDFALLFYKRDGAGEDHDAGKR